MPVKNHLIDFNNPNNLCVVVGMEIIYLLNRKY